MLYQNQKSNKMKKLILSILALAAFNVFAQDVYLTKAGHIRFFSSTPLEDIEGKSKDAVSALNTKTGEIVAQIQIKSFRFEKSLMEEHFNENYMESEKFPKAVLKAKILELEKYDFSKDGEQKVVFEGDLTIHGVTKKVKLEGTIKKSGKNVQAKSVFKVKLADYNIKVPSVVTKNIAEDIEVTVDFPYELKI